MRRPPLVKTLVQRPPLVKTLEDVRQQVATFNRSARRHPDAARALIRATDYWVYDPRSRQFGPSKYVGHQGMSFDWYADHSRPRHDGGKTRTAIANTLKSRYSSSIGLASLLVSWADALLADGTLDSINQSKWTFIEIDYGPSNGASLLEPDVGGTDEDLPDDEREPALRTIRARRGQQKWRKRLIDTHGPVCMISGCAVVHLLEAAHIEPYQSVASQRVKNGLLLRSDLHTLFDLNLLGINPDDLTVHLHPEVMRDGYELFHGTTLHCVSQRLDRSLLKPRWESFSGRS